MNADKRRWKKNGASRNRDVLPSDDNEEEHEGKEQTEEDQF
jgi:hypothetical protein